MLPLVLTAACAACVNKRRRFRFPLGDRLLRFTSAVWSVPGHDPIQEENPLGEGKLDACGPTSATTWCAESTPQPGVGALGLSPPAAKPSSIRRPLTPSTSIPAIL